MRCCNNTIFWLTGAAKIQERFQTTGSSTGYWMSGDKRLVRPSKQVLFIINPAFHFWVKNSYKTNCWNSLRNYASEMPLTSPWSKSQDNLWSHSLKIYTRKKFRWCSGKMIRVLFIVLPTSTIKQICFKWQWPRQAIQLQSNPGALPAGADTEACPSRKFKAWIETIFILKTRYSYIFRYRCFKENVTGT